MKHFSYFDFFKHAASTPLSNILLNSQLALSDQENKEKSLKRILLSANYLKDLLDNHEQKKRELFLVNDALVEIILLNQCFHQEVAYCKKIHQSHNIKLSGNKLLFQEVINCLLNNAIEAYRSNSLEKIVLIKTQLKNNNLELSVTDGGSGLTWFQQQLIGRKYYSLKDDHQGVGLFYAKKILKNEFSAKIQFLSKKNHGSTVLLNFPLDYNPK
ncbi:MAG TPA: HAMP domain-containing sensor histidine kinase [Candidatus Woesebacteria bacterium]|jgi:sensor histidine kinase regulating citrate/malate metabolism|nr:HAMP domain-containing sensor histidine kinase [Candidatus Woesebacteria bacterium]HOC07345.1 HAMP domain-containing sensor histidine kinase [Candidatus Woesebacteria bacterium]HOP39167.1 HAMP domain-containing sensor histidine kinase [Candidatus Woesebacteria bacterium]HPA61901.1 HAMP domain-containing sensor histidine kinase [Candidatus Woesebacteria bacterium]HPK08135.1 HAMP domain-containing sensor histidine kinase [Candidatus Woesebacteria bacterium]